MGHEAEVISNASEMTEDEKLIYKSIKDCFDKLFVGENNAIFHPSRFNMQQQQPGKTANSFMTAVHKLAENCQFRPLKAELIHDSIVVGMRDVFLS